MAKGLSRREWFGGILGTITGWLAYPLIRKLGGGAPSAPARPAPTYLDYANFPQRFKHIPHLVTTFTYDAGSRCTAMKWQSIDLAYESGDGIAPSGPAFAHGATETYRYEGRMEQSTSAGCIRGEVRRRGQRASS
jgi:hypothetical protein